jgi:hypothetical protein
MGGRRKLGEPGVGCPGACSKVERLGKSGCSYTEGRSGSDTTVYREVIDATLPGKASKR